MPRDDEQAGRRRVFPTTPWTLVVEAARTGNPEYSEALAELCRIYWYPLYVHARGTGHDCEDARDLVQGFFASFLARGSLARAAREKGKLRTYLRASLDHFAANERKAASAKRRGGGWKRVPFEIDVDSAEGRYHAEFPRSETPAQLYERRWAQTVVDRALGALEERYRRSGRLELFRVLSGFIPFTEGDAPGMRQVGTALGMSDEAVRVAVHRLRTRFRQCVEQEVGRTVASPADVEEEIRYLLRVLTG